MAFCDAASDPFSPLDCKFSYRSWERIIQSGEMVFSVPPASDEHHKADSCDGEDTDCRRLLSTPLRATAKGSAETGDCCALYDLAAIGESSGTASEGDPTNATTACQELYLESDAGEDEWIDTSGGLEWAANLMEAERAASMGSGAAQQQSSTSLAGSRIGLDGVVVGSGGLDVINNVDDEGGCGSVVAEAVTDCTKANFLARREVSGLFQEEKGIASPDWLDVTHAMLHETNPDLQLKK